MPPKGCVARDRCGLNKFYQASKQTLTVFSLEVLSLKSLHDFLQVANQITPTVIQQDLLLKLYVLNAQ